LSSDAGFRLLSGSTASSTVSVDVFELMPFTTELQHATDATTIMIVQKCCNSTSVATVAKNTARESSILSARINFNRQLFAENTINNLDKGWVCHWGILSLSFHLL